jgi:hypothetical protein
MNVTTLAPPAVEPVGLAEMKDFLRISSAGEDDLVGRLIAGARARIEEAVGLALVSRTLRVTLEAWPSAMLTRRSMALPVRPAGAHAGVTAALGDPLRVLDVASPQPAHPYLEIFRHQSLPSGSAGCDGSAHTIDMAVVSRDEGGALAREAMAQVREALRDAEFVMAGWHCTLLLPVFGDTMRQAIGRWRSVLRVKAVIEAV